MKSKIVTFTFCFIFIMSSSAIFAADWIDMEWSAYNLSFQVPSDMKEYVNTEKQYGVTGSVSLTINPWKDATITERDAAQKAYDTVKGIDNRQLLDEGDLPDMEESGLRGYYMIGSGYQNKRALYFLFVGVINPNSDVNFYLCFMWWDDPKTNDVKVQLCEDIVKTFRVAGYEEEYDY